MERGEALALSSGSVCAWWGFVLAFTNLWNVAERLHLAPHLWPMAITQITAGYGGTLVLTRVIARKPLFSLWRTQAIATIWLLSGAAIIVFVTGSVIAGFYNDMVNNAVLAIIFALNMAVMATSGRVPWLLVAAGGWIGAAFGMFLLRNAMQWNILFGFTALTCMMLPGLQLWREERRGRRLRQNGGFASSP